MKKIQYSIFGFIIGVLLIATTSSFATIQQGAAGLLTQIGLTKMWVSSTAPYINSGFGYAASAVLTNANGTGAFEVPISGAAATSGVLVLPTASNGWTCQLFAEDSSASAVLTKQIASTASSVTIANYTAAGVAQAWSNNAVLHGSCFAY